VLDAATAAAAAAVTAATVSATATIAATVSTPLARSAAQPQLLRQQSQLLPQQQQQQQQATQMLVAAAATSDTHSRTRSAIRRKMDFLLREGLHVSADDSAVTVGAGNGHGKKRQQQPKEPAADAVAEGLQMYVREYRPLSASARDRGGAVSRGRVRPATAGAARSSAAL
jgi:hypothetical protein